jgi:hypothetical protein
VQEVPGLNLAHVTKDSVIFIMPLLNISAKIMLQNTSWPVPSTLFHIRYSLFFPAFDFPQYALLMASLIDLYVNKGIFVYVVWSEGLFSHERYY